MISIEKLRDMNLHAVADELEQLRQRIADRPVPDAIRLLQRVAASTTDKPAVAAPDGWKLVPVEITDAMVDASGCEGQYKLSGHEQAQRLWSEMLAAAPSHSQQSAESSESLREIIEREADRFFEWPSADKSHVTAVSTKLFAEHIATLYASPDRCPSHEGEQGGEQ